MVEDSTSISWESAYNISCSQVDVLIFLCPFIWSCVSGNAIFMMVSTASVHQSLAMTRQVFWEESTNRAWVFEWHARFVA
jgi:hypothetical protein